MLHLRVVCGPDRTDSVLGYLREHRGATHIVALRGAALEPPGDVIEADVAREAGDEVIDELRRWHVDDNGYMTLETIDIALSVHADKAKDQVPGEAADAVLWEELAARTGEESRFSFTCVALATIACLLAAIAVVTDSAVTLVGAMVLGPEFGALAAVAVGLVRRRWSLVRVGSVALVVAFPLAMAITAGAMALFQAFGLFDATVLDGPHELDFVYQVGPWSLIVALLAGAAGMLSLTAARSAVLVGVFISVTTMPAAGYAAVAAILGDWSRCLSSIGQLALNMVGVVVAASLVLIMRSGRREFRTESIDTITVGAREPRRSAHE